MDGSVTATGLQELRQAIDRFPQTVTDRLRAVAFRKSREVLARAQQLVPVDTGYTRDNIHVEEVPERKLFQVIPGTDRPRVRIAWKTMKRSGRSFTQKVSLNMLPNWLEYGTRFMVARPFMRPAADAVEPSYRREMLAEAERAAETLAVK